MSNARKLADNLPTEGSLSGRNMIVNGSMNVAQRGSVAAIQTGYGACDRFKLQSTSAARFDTSQSTDVPSGQGFANSLKLDCSTADTSLASGDYYFIMHQMEGLNLQHLKYGTSDAVQCTLSFWVKSPKTGIHNVEIEHVDGGKFNTHQYTIAAANTWQNVKFTFDGNTAASIVNDATCGMLITWWLQAGSGFTSGTHTSGWYSGNSNRAVGQVNVSDSTSNDFYLTGVQLEVGPQSTPFEYRSFGDELLRCKRYFEVYSPTTSDNGSIGVIRTRTNNNSYQGLVNFLEKRVQPTCTIDFNIIHKPGVSKESISSISVSLSGGETQSCTINVTPSNDSTISTTGFLGVNSGTGSLKIDAEL